MAKLLIVLFSVCQVLAYACACNCTKSSGKQCLNSDSPVCATNGTHWFLFKNQCRVKAENKNRESLGISNLQITEISKCFKNCNQVCTNEYAPICTRSAEVQKTFENRCRLDLENCKTANKWAIFHEGECSAATPPILEPNLHPKPLIVQKDCPTYCSLEFKPLCAAIGSIEQTFQNQCHLKADMCESKRTWEVIHDGECIEPESKCEEHCPRIYSPMCATFNGENKTFTNECFLDLEICVSGNYWNILYNGECRNQHRECPKICPEVHQPVCATLNGKLRVFSSRCSMQITSCRINEDWKILNEGDCEPFKHPHLPIDQQICPDVCPAVYNPVCGFFNGSKRTFSNGCYLRSKACKSREDWKIIFNGPCENEHEAQPRQLPHTQVSITQRPKIKPSQTSFKIPSVHNKPLLSNPPHATYTNTEPIASQLSCANPPCSQFSSVNSPLHTQVSYTQLASTQHVYAQQSHNKNSFAHPLSTQPRSSDPTHAQLPQIRPQDNHSIHVQKPPLIKLPLSLAKSSQSSLDQLSRDNTQQPQSQAPYPKNPLINPIISHPSFIQPKTFPLQTTSNAPALACPICSDSYKPVCGIHDEEEQTFNNECLLISENCYSDKKWVVAYEGECQNVYQPSGCPNICPLNYDPVCATFNGIKRTFPNECELNHEAYRKNTHWVIISVGECDYCPICSNEFEPVCAELNGRTRTFDNACKMEAENCRTKSAWKIVSRNSCEVNNCPKQCPNIYIPICATSNGAYNTFGNICEMKIEACNSRTVWNVVSRGECPAFDEHCPKSCSLKHNPVCAYHKGVYREFVNECFLRSEICKTKKDWEFVNSGSCIFPNATQYADPNHGPAASVSNAPTTPVSKPKCHLNKCLAFNDPVCAVFNGKEKTFQNTCFLQNTNCRTGEDWKTIRSGSCGRKLTPRSRV